MSTASATPARRRYIDWARGIAVLIMIEAHTLDAWTRLDARSSKVFGYLILLGGLAAPLFLWLAGLGLVLSAERVLARSAKRSVATEAVVHRGVEIFLLAFLFRLQAFVVSPGSSLVTLFRVDILNVMGPAMVLAGILWGLSGTLRRSAVVCGAAATLLAMVTPLIRKATWVDALPTLVSVVSSPVRRPHDLYTPAVGWICARGSGFRLCSGAVHRRTDRTAPAVGLDSRPGPWSWRRSFFTAITPDDLPGIELFDQFANLFRSAGRHPDVGAGDVLRLSGAEPWFPRAFGVLETFGRNSFFVFGYT